MKVLNYSGTKAQSLLGRKLAIVFTMRGALIRIISARDMNRKERKFYEKGE